MPQHITHCPHCGGALSSNPHPTHVVVTPVQKHEGAYIETGGSRIYRLDGRHRSHGEFRYRCFGLDDNLVHRVVWGGRTESDIPSLTGRYITGGESIRFINASINPEALEAAKKEAA